MICQCLIREENAGRQLIILYDLHFTAMNLEMSMRSIIYVN